MARDGYNCSLALAETAYDLFIGQAADNTSAQYYTRERGNADVRFGWALAPCDTFAGFLCEVCGLRPDQGHTLAAGPDVLIGHLQASASRRPVGRSHLRNLPPKPLSGAGLGLSVRPTAQPAAQPAATAAAASAACPTHLRATGQQDVNVRRPVDQLLLVRRRRRHL